MRIRRNADRGLRAAEREWHETGTAAAHARYLRAAIQQGRIQPELVAMAAYLGNEAAQIVGVPPTPGPRSEPWEYGSRSLEVLTHCPISAKHATLFAADCTQRALESFGHENEHLLDLSMEALAISRAWVLGTGSLADPQEFADAMHQDNEFSYQRSALHSSSYAYDAALAVVAGARRRPSEVTKAVIRYTVLAASQPVYGQGVSRREVDRALQLRHAEVGRREAAWQDAHFARCLLEPRWPGVET